MRVHQLQVTTLTLLRIYGNLAATLKSKQDPRFAAESLLDCSSKDCDKTQKDGRSAGFHPYYENQHSLRGRPTV